MPGLVLRIQVQQGQAVVAGQPIVALEAMKMENELRATAPGVVQTIAVVAGQAVEKGAVLVEFAAPAT
jgi:biotin carboxyl carrier protein